MKQHIVFKDSQTPTAPRLRGVVCSSCRVVHADLLNYVPLHHHQARIYFWLSVSHGVSRWLLDNSAKCC